MSRIRLAVFDLDGILLRGDTVCEVLARHLGRLDRMRQLEASALSTDEIVRAREEMAGWYEGHGLAELQEFAARARLAPGAREGCGLLVRAGVEVSLASLTWEFAVEWFARELGARSWLATSLATDGTIGHVWAQDKARWLDARIDTAGLSRWEVAAVGDSAGDVPLLCSAGLPVFVGRDLVSGLPASTRHLPAADLREVAQLILDESVGHSVC